MSQIWDPNWVIFSSHTVAVSVIRKLGLSLTRGEKRGATERLHCSRSYSLRLGFSCVSQKQPQFSSWIHNASTWPFHCLGYTTMKVCGIHILQFHDEKIGVQSTRGIEIGLERRSLYLEFGTIWKIRIKRGDIYVSTATILLIFTLWRSGSFLAYFDLWLAFLFLSLMIKAWSSWSRNWIFFIVVRSLRIFLSIVFLGDLYCSQSITFSFSLFSCPPLLAS